MISESEGALAECHDHIHPEQFMQNCVTDVCGRGGDAGSLEEVSFCVIHVNHLFST